MQPGERRRGLRLPYKAGRGGGRTLPRSPFVGAAVMAVAASERGAGEVGEGESADMRARTVSDRGRGEGATVAGEVGWAAA
jgi:hypothetical protein